jgi:hypothetical protein
MNKSVDPDMVIAVDNSVDPDIFVGPVKPLRPQRFRKKE